MSDELCICDVEGRRVFGGLSMGTNYKRLKKIVRGRLKRDFCLHEEGVLNDSWPLGLCEVSSVSCCSLPIGITNYFVKTCELKKDVPPLKLLFNGLRCPACGSTVNNVCELHTASTFKDTF